MAVLYGRKGQPLRKKLPFPPVRTFVLKLGMLGRASRPDDSGARQRAVMGSSVDRLPTRRESYGVGQSFEREPKSPVAHRRKKKS